MSNLRRRLRLVAQWLCVGLAHAATLGAVLQAAPPPPRTLPTIIQASLIAPQPLMAGLPDQPQSQPPPEKRLEPPPPKPPKPKKTKPPKKTKTLQRPPEKPPEAPKPLLAAAPISEEAPPAAFEVPQAPAEPEPPPPTTASTGSTGTGTPTGSAGGSSAGNSATGTVTPPIFNADYLENPHPPYPQLSHKYGETGRVVLRVRVSAKGRAERVEINSSSGFSRLDTAARDAVYGWRFVPAKRGNENVAAWVLVPILFVL